MTEPARSDDFSNATYENVPEFIPDIRHGKVIRVYDGDTFTIAARISVDGNELPKLFRFTVRLNGIDTPEIRTKNQTEKRLAILARDNLAELLFGSVVILQNVSYDKYGRILADVITKDGVNVSRWMIENGHAVEYDGGAKKRPSEWTDS